MEVEEAVDRIVSAMRDNMPALVNLIRVRLREQVAEFYSSDDPALSSVEGETIPASLEFILQGLTDQRDVWDAVPGSMLKQARVAAQANVSLHALLRKQRVAHAITWDSFLAAAHEAIADDHLRSTALRRISQYHFAWNDHVIATLVSEYEAEYRLYFTERPDRKKRAMVNAILGGAPPDEEALRYPIAGRHLAVIAWGEHPESSIKLVASNLGGKHLVVLGTDDAYFGWVRRATRAATSDVDLSNLELPPNTQIACGRYGNDVEGFRTSHVQAGLAYRVARLTDRPVTWYRDVSLEALALRDVPAAQEFVRQELGTLLDGSRRSQTLLETIKTYYSLGQNAAATGARLDINERTVAYRLRATEELLGSTVWGRRDEIGVAIRIADLVERATAAGLSAPTAF